MSVAVEYLVPEPGRRQRRARRQRMARGTSLTSPETVRVVDELHASTSQGSGATTAPPAEWSWASIATQGEEWSPESAEAVGLEEPQLYVFRTTHGLLDWSGILVDVSTLTSAAAGVEQPRQRGVFFFQHERERVSEMVVAIRLEDAPTWRPRYFPAGRDRGDG